MLFIAVCKRTVPKEEFQYSVRSDEKAYYDKAISSFVPFQTDLNSINAGIVSHHLYVSEYIANLFYSIQKIKPSVQTIVVIGPNHYSQGKNWISLSKRKWKTPYGFVQADLGKIKLLNKLNNSGVDEDAFFNEHSIGSLLPYISYYFPKSKIVPIILNFRLSWKAASELGVLLSEIIQKDDLLIISTDFVHDKRNYEMKTIDKKNKEILTNYTNNMDWNQVTQLENDCRKCLLTLFRFLKEKGSPKTEVLLNTNSAEASGLDVPGTSYFFVLYGK